MTKKTLRALLFVITTALLICLGYYCYLVDKASGGNVSVLAYVYICGLTVMTCLSAYYALAGCNKKDGSSFFKLYMLVFSIYEFFGLAGHDGQATLQVMTMAIRMCVLVLLARALDLGEKRSYNCTYILMACSVVDVAVQIKVGSFAYVWFSIALEFLLALVCFLMVRAKYLDKKERNSK